MRKISLLLMALMLALVASAEPANPTPVTVKQPNGENLRLVLVGDEYYHFNTTVDGYTIINNKGRWEYATLMGEKLSSTGVLAHDPATRGTQERTMLAAMPKHLVDKSIVADAARLRSTRDKKNNVGKKEAVVDYSKFRGLIILINYNDRQFGMSDPNSFYDQLCNTENYSGFYHQGSFQRCTGSVRDYYYDNSMGQFDPEFDVVGPVNLNYSCYEGDSKARQIFRDALAAVDSQVDFTNYDADNDGSIDMVFFMVAGYSSSYSGNNEGYLWPHMSYLYNDSYPYYIQLDGKYMGRYASSCEIYGWESYGYTIPNAIGTICHEFGHVLGLPDLYDTDYSGSGGESNHPGGWDVMAGGSHYNYGRTPVGYSLWERWELGFTSEPPALTPGAKSLQAVNISNTGYRLPTNNDNEFFLFENRQPNKWDSTLPGHGLLVTRVDYSNPQAWQNNDVNSDPSHNYYELVRAYDANEGSTAFPSSHNVTELNSVTDPALLTWAGEPCQYGLADITEQNNIITFNVVNDVIPSMLIEDFEAMEESSNATDELGSIGTWSFQRAKVVTDANANGSKAASMTSPSYLTMNSDVAINSFKVSVKAVNTSAAATAKLQLSYSTDEGENWTPAGSMELDGGTNTTLEWRLKINQPVRYKLSQTSGSKTKPIIIDDFTIHYTDSAVYELRIAGQQVNGVNMGNLSQLNGVEGVVQYLPISNTLRLKDASISRSSSMGLSCSIPNITLNVNGTNTINSGQNGMTLNIESAKINGEGSLKVTSQRQMGLVVGSGFVIEGGVHLELDGYNFGIIGGGSSASASTSLTINGSGTVVKARGQNASTIANLGSLVLNNGLTFLSPEGAYFNSDTHAVTYQNGENVSGEWIVIGKNASVAGDVNGDGECTGSDVTALYNFILYMDDSAIVNGDQNGDGEITGSDVTAVYNIILGLN